MLKITVKRISENVIKVYGNGLTEKDIFNMACQLKQKVYIEEDRLICDIEEHTEEIIDEVISTNHDIEDYQCYFTPEEKWISSEYTLYE